MLKEQIEEWLKRYKIINYTINDDLSVNVNINAYLSFNKLKEFPVQFNKVNGNFWCFCNQLTSLKGSPKEVNGDFWCSNNQLTSLKYSPKRIKGWFSCYHNKLKEIELQYIPKGITRFNCDNHLKKTSEYKIIRAKIKLMNL